MVCRWLQIDLGTCSFCPSVLVVLNEVGVWVVLPTQKGARDAPSRANGFAIFLVLDTQMVSISGTGLVTWVSETGRAAPRYEDPESSIKLVFGSPIRSF